MVRRFVLFTLLAVSAAVPIFGSAVPIGTIPVGDSPFALALSSNDQQAVVVNLFPTPNPNGSPGPNIRLLDVVNLRQLSAFSLGTRLVAVALSGTTALVVNEDQDALRLVDVTTNRQIAQIPVGSRPSNVLISGPNTAIVTNGTSGNLSFVDIANRRVIGSPITVGTDPRGGAVHPAGRYAYITLGGENALAVVDLGASPQAVVTKIPVGKNPVAVSVTPDGSRAVVANLTSNSVTVLSLANPAAPVALMNVPVGVQPTAIAVNPAKPNVAYVANLGSLFFAAVDLSADSDKTALLGVVQMDTGASGIRVSGNGTRLFLTEFKNQANLRIYDLTNLPLDPSPAIDIPGEPRLTTFLDASGVCSFYIAEATLAAGQKEGFWGMEVGITQGLLTGGFNLGGAFEGNGQLPGFGAFSLSSPQHVTVNVAAQPFAGTTGQVGLDVALKSNGTRIAGATGAPPLTFSADLDPGFYVAEIDSLPGTPRGTFQMGLNADAFAAGVVVGGFITGNVTGFGAFCVPNPQNVSVHLLGNSEYGASGAGDLVLTVRDAQRNVLRTVNNSIPVAAPSAPPAPPDTSKLTIRWYVDASAATGGDGSSAKPFRSLTQAFGRAQSGDVIFVRAGRYSRSLTGEVLPINNLRSGVTVIGAGAATTIVDGENIDQNAVVIVASNTRIAGFTFRNAGQVGLYVANANNVTIDHNFFTANARFGVGSQNTRGLIVTDNVSVSNNESGMAFSGAIGLATANAPANCPASPSGLFGAYVVNNTSSDNRADGILFSQGGNVCVANNVTRNNGSSGIELNNRQDVPTPPLNGSIVSNEITGNGGVQFGFAGTGILVTEGARADLIQQNRLTANRPYGIGIFLNAKAGLISQNTVADTPGEGILVQRSSTTDEISDNTVTNSGQSGFFIDNLSTVTRILRNTATGNGTGMSILSSSTVTTVDQNSIESNSAGMEVSIGATAATVSNNSFNNNDGGGVFIRANASITNFRNNRARNNRGLGGMSLDGQATVTVSGSDFSNNGATGISLANGSNAVIQDSTVNANQAEGGISATGGSQATVTGTTIDGNTKQGVLASDAGTTVSLNGGDAVTNTQGLGLNSQNGAAIRCSGSNSIRGNTTANTFGAVTGCQ